MDKKLTFLGGEPDINIDDLLRDPIANRAALFGLMLGLGVTTDCIVSGAAVTVDPLVDADVSAGYVWLDGEILQVDAATVSETQGTDLWEFQKVVAYDSAGDKTFNDGTPRQTWQQNRAVLVNVGSISGLDAVNAPSLLATVVNNQKASQPEVNAGVVDSKIVTPAKLIALQATETQKGLAEVATQAETNTGTDDEKMVTPSKLDTYKKNVLGIALHKNAEMFGDAITSQEGPGANLSISNPSTGTYVFTHNIGGRDYIPVINSASGNNLTSWSVVKGTNDVTVKGYIGTTLTDPSTTWHISLLRINYSAP
jgi:hypothetical protein